MLTALREGLKLWQQRKGLSLRYRICGNMSSDVIASFHRLRAIYPEVKATGHVLTIPMPGRCHG